MVASIVKHREKHNYRSRNTQENISRLETNKKTSLKINAELGTAVSHVLHQHHRDGGGVKTEQWNDVRQSVEHPHLAMPIRFHNTADDDSQLQSFATHRPNANTQTIDDHLG